MNNSTMPIDKASRLKVILYGVFVGEGVAIFIANGLTLATYASCKNLRKRSAYCLLSVALADAFVGFSAILRNTSRLTSTYTGVFKAVSRFLWYVSAAASLYGLILVAVERAYVICFPLRNLTTTSARYAVGMGLQWGLAITVGALQSFDEENEHIVLFIKYTITLLGLVVISVSYTTIFVQVRKQRQQEAIPRTQRRERDLALTLFVVTVLSLVTWLPESVYHLLPQYRSSAIEHRVLQALRLANSIVNPVVFMLRIMEFRKALFEMLRRMVLCKKSTDLGPRPSVSIPSIAFSYAEGRGVEDVKINRESASELQTMGISNATTDGSSTIF